MTVIGRWLRGLVAAAALAALVVGIPWGLARFVGWPLPDHLPRWEEIEAVLLSPLSAYLLVDVLATLSWVVWGVFVLDLLLCLAESARHLRLPAVPDGRPTRALAAVLVTAVALAVVGNRVAAAGGTQVVATSSGLAPQVVVTTPMWSSPPPLVRATPTRLSAERVVPPTSVLVRAPSGGVHDSLWRIAARSLGDGKRWPEIFELNRGMPQPYGRVFTRPSLVYPGQELRLPETRSTPSGEAGSADPTPGPTSPSDAPRPAPATPGEPTEQAPVATSRESASFDPTLVGAVLAAAAGALLAEVLRRSRRRYVPGSGDRHDLEYEPIVRELRFRHLRHQEDEPDSADPLLDDPDDPGESADLDLGGTDGMPAGSGEVTPKSVPAETWREDARDIGLALAATRGLGLIGEGALAAVRALLLTALAGARHTEPHPTVIVTARCLDAVFGDTARSALPSTVQIAEDLLDAVDIVEQEVLRRIDQESTGGEWPPLVLVAEVPLSDHPRLQSVLDNGAQVAVVGLMLGQWLPGVTAYIRADGTVSTTSPGPGEHLRGTRLFGLEPVEAVTLLELLRDAAAHDDSGQMIDIVEPFDGDLDGEDEQADAVAVSDPADDSEAVPRPSSPEPVDGSTHPPAARSVEIRVFGPPQVLLLAGPAEAEAVDITSSIQPRVRELLMFLALHPGGTTREAVAAALWPSSPPGRISNAMNTSLSRLRRAIESATAGKLSHIVRTSDTMLRIDGDLVRTDFEAFDAALQARRVATTGEARAEADEAVVDNYGGQFAEGMSTEWIETARAGIQRAALDSVAGLARVLVDEDPQRTLDLLETARAFEPHNEHVYRDIMRLQARLGQPDGVSRTLALLASRLTEIDEAPTPATVELARRLTSDDRSVQPNGHATATV